MHNNLCWPNPTLASENIKCISTYVDQTPPMPGRTQDASQLVDQTHPMPARTQNVCQPVLIKPILCKGINKIHLNICWPNPSCASMIIKCILTLVEEKCISTCVDQTHPMPSRTQNASQLVPSKSNPCQRLHKMHLNMCWPNPSHASEETKWISICDNQTNPRPASTQNAYLHVLTEPIPC